MHQNQASNSGEELKHHYRPEDATLAIADVLQEGQMDNAEY